MLKFISNNYHWESKYPIRLNTAFTSKLSTCISMAFAVKTLVLEIFLCGKNHVRGTFVATINFENDNLLENQILVVGTPIL